MTCISTGRDLTLRLRDESGFAGTMRNVTQSGIRVKSAVNITTADRSRRRRRPFPDTTQTISVYNLRNIDAFRAHVELLVF